MAKSGSTPWAGRVLGGVCISGSPPKILVCQQKLMNFDVLYGKIGFYPVGGSGPKGSSCLWGRGSRAINGFSHLPAKLLNGAFD